MRELEEVGLGAAWIGDGLRYLADGGHGSEAFKSYVHFTAFFTLAFKGHPGSEAFVISEKSQEKIIPKGDPSVDNKNLTWLVARSDKYADKLSGTALHSGSVGTLAQTYRRALKLLEILGFRETSLPSLEKSSRALVASFAMSVLHGIKWGDSIGNLNQPQDDLGCSPALVTFALACLRQPMAKKFFLKGGTTMNPEYSARATQLITRASSLKKVGPDFSFERNFLLAPILTPQMGVVQWRLKTKTGRDVVKAIQTKAGQPPYNLIDESEIISSLLEESYDDGREGRGYEGGDQGGDQGAVGDGRAAKGAEGEDDGSLGGDGGSAKAKDEGAKHKEHVASEATLCIEGEEDSLKATRAQAESAEEATKKLCVQLVANVMEQQLLATVRADGARETTFCPERTVIEVERSTGSRPSTDSLRTRPDKGNKRTRSPSPVKISERNRGQRGIRSPKNNSDLPSYPENIHTEWSYSRIKEAQRRMPGVCRRLPGECKPWIGNDGKYRTCRFAHPWLAKGGQG